jgi:uncharacterized protein YbcC (UPF0753/DUF2309 family)
MSGVRELAAGDRPGLDRPAGADMQRVALEAAIDGACARIAPLWPLKHFVAVNPFLGFAGQSFHATCATLRRVARISMLMPRAFYREAAASGRIGEADMQAALNAASSIWRPPANVAALRAALAQDPLRRTRHHAVVATVAEVLDSLAGGDRNASRTAFMTDEISKWCAAYFDAGQAVWQLPSRGLAPYAAWRQSMRHDRNPEVMGIAGFRALVAELPDSPVESIAEVVRRLGVPHQVAADYLHQSLLDVSGWAAYGRYLVWTSELAGRTDDTLVQLLAIRVVWGYTLFKQRTDAAFQVAWRQAMADAALPSQDERLGNDADLCVDLIMQEAYEMAWQRQLLARFAPGMAPDANAPAPRPVLQAAFCIDVRSEIYRRALESQSPDLCTTGFAGFFGFPIEYIPIGHVRGGAQCPVLLNPAFIVCETVRDISAAENAGVLSMRLLRRRVTKAWKSFKLSAVSSFIYVETAGLLFAAKILSDSLALTRPVHDPNTDGLDARSIGRLGPRVDSAMVDGRQTGFNAKQGVDQAEAVLRGMSMTAGFARLVLLVGHGSTTVNNPHATGLDCGACGGHTGEANARVAATILNDPEVRAGLRARGIDVPYDTWFLGCLHDTTTDDIAIFDAASAPPSHAPDLAQARNWLARASTLARLERTALLHIAPGPKAEANLIARSRDWAQVRPEWGLAGNAAFIAAPRSRTRGIDFGGRAFLHEYIWQDDAGFGVLELILTAPMVVASWINLQYYGSTVNNRVFGAGNKVLHNVTGTIGVLEGNAGDLKIGLPWQSVHDGSRFVHEPLRLNVIVEAPMEAINAIVEKSETVRHLVDNHWVHLFAMAQDGRISHRYASACRWESVV